MSRLICAETIAPIAAIASSPATRAIALLTPEAMPALCSSASASTVAVSGATVIDSPSREDSSAGQQVASGSRRSRPAAAQRAARAADQRAGAT